MRRRCELAGSVPMRREEAFSVLADAAGYGEWLPGVLESRILESEGDVAVIEVRAPAYRAAPLVMELVRSPPEEIRFREVGRFGKPDVEGRLELRHVRDGTEVRCTLTVEAPLFRFGVHRHLHDAAGEALASLARYAATVRSQGRHPAAGETGAAGRRKLFEIFEQGGGLELHVGTEIYPLVPAGESEASS